MPTRREQPLRNVHGDQQSVGLLTPAKGPLSLAKPKHAAEAFRSPESTGNLNGFSYTDKANKPGDDNWDDDFATAISPSALHLPQFKPHDNFGGLLSADRLKAYASFEMSNEDNSDNWDHNFEGDLTTIKAPRRNVEPDGTDLETIRPYRVKPTVITQNITPAVAPKKIGRKASYSAPPRAKPPVKPQTEAKFVLPSRPANMYREQSVEDYSDLFVDNDSVFNRRLDIVKVCNHIFISCGTY
jgi:hypothetical protein